MKTLILLMSVMLLPSTKLFSQGTKNDILDQTLIDVYFKDFSTEPGYKTSVLSSDMIHHFIESGDWKNANLVNFMNQLKFEKTLHFKCNAEHFQEIIMQLEKKIKSERFYRVYYSQQEAGSASYVFTRTSGNKIIEIANIVFNDAGLGIDCYVADNINIESIRKIFRSN